MSWLQTVSRADADTALTTVYDAMAARPMPEAYRPPHDDVAGIIRAHSLDPELLRLTFSASGALHGEALQWWERELLSGVTSRTNECFY